MSKLKIIILFSLTMMFTTIAHAEPIILQTQYNTVLLPKPAKRIVVLEFSLLDDLLQLGVTPIGFASSRTDEGTNPPFLLSKLDNVIDVGTRQQPNFEKIISLHPDLIVADTTMQREIYPLLKQIAPTLMLNGLLGDLNTQEKNLQILAQATGTEDKTDTLVKQLKTSYVKAKKIAAQHPATVIIGYANNAGQFQALTANALTSQILQEFSHSNLITVSREEQSTPIPVETILAKNPDKIVVLLTNGNLDPYRALTQHPLWKELRAVKTQHVYFMDRDIWAKNHGILATELLLKEAQQTGFLTNQPNNKLMA